MKTLTRKTARPLLSSLLFSLVTAALPMAGHAQGAPPPPPPRGGGFQALGLNPDQMRRVRALHQQIGPQIRDLERNLRDRRKALEALYTSYDLDLAQARRLNAQIHETQQNILEANLRLQVELRKILTADQFQKLQESIAARRQNHPGPPPHQ